MARSVDSSNQEQMREQHLLFDASDYWDLSVRSLVKQISEDVHHGRADAGKVEAQLDKALSGLQRRQQWIAQTCQEALNTLNLPAWRRRHELYSVWIGTALLRTARRCADEFQFHPNHGVLSFSFAGNRLATYVSGAARFDIWCELRSALVGPSKKRKKGIQPDFRVVEAGVALDPGVATRLVLECKHYLGFSRSNFRAAATDYARGCPNAEVLLVNHGPADHDLLVGGIDARLSSKILFRGDVTADAPVRPNSVERDLERLLFPQRTAAASHAPLADADAAESPSYAVPGSLRLEWTAELGDLDLALEVFDANQGLVDRIDYKRLSGQCSPPIARLKEDARSGPAAEVIEVAAWKHAVYAVTVTNYSGIGRITPSNTACIVVIAGRELRIVPPPGGVEGNSWKVISIDTRASAASVPAIGQAGSAPAHTFHIAVSPQLPPSA